MLLASGRWWRCGLIPSVGDDIKCWVCQVGRISTILLIKDGGSDFGIKSIGLLLGDRNMLSPRLCL